MMSTLQFNQTNNGKSITLQQGEQFCIQLPENPTTGYRWELDQLTSNDAILTLETTRFVPATAAIGSGGDRSFIFKAAQAGSTHLHLKLWRSWEGEGSVTNHYHLNVQVMNGN